MQIDTKTIAVRLKRGTAAISKAARKGTFGKTARQDSRGRWLFDWPAAGKAFRQNTDPTRYSVRDLAPDTVDVVVYESERGRLGISVELHAKLQHAAENETEDLITPEMAKALDQLLEIVGVVAS